MCSLWEARVRLHTVVKPQPQPLSPQPLERQVGDRALEYDGVHLAVGAVPLDQRVHHPEQQPADQVRGDVVAQRALVDGGLHQAGEPVVEGAAAA